MVAKYKRIPIQLEPVVDELLEALSEETHASKAAIIQGLLHEFIPALETQLKVIRMAKKDRAKALRLADNFMVEGMSNILKARSDAHGDSDGDG